MGARISRTWRVVLIVLVLLVAFRLSLPYVVTRHVNNVLSDLGEYQGSVRSVDIDLYRGAYELDSLVIFKSDSNHNIPFITIPSTDLSIEWKSIFQGALVGQIIFEKPALNFIVRSKGEHQSDTSLRAQNGKEVDWTIPLKEIMPFDINRIMINDGRVIVHDLSRDRKNDVFLKNIELDALNLSNAKDNPERLPARVYLQALSIGNGQLNVAMSINPLEKLPDLDMDLRFENVNLNMLNEFFGAYGEVDVKQGHFSLFSEVSVSDGKVTGFVKPMFQDLRVIDVKLDPDKPIQLAWESMMGFMAQTIRKQKQSQVTTRVDLQGDIASVEASFWPSLWSLFGNAFISALEVKDQPAVTVTAVQREQAAETEMASTKEPEEADKKDLKKEKRKEKREERRRARKERRERENAKAEENKSAEDDSGV
jgi:hypothetical protein